MLASVQRTILPEADWRARRQAHEQRVLGWTEPHQARTARGEPMARAMSECSFAVSGMSGVCL